jgi:CBS domain-containing protein
MTENAFDDTLPAATMAVASLTGDPVARVPGDADLAAIARAMVEGEVGALVVGDDDRPAGIVSERDLVHALASGRAPATTADELAHRELFWCDAAATVAEVAEQMMDHYVRHILVEEDGRLVGIVSARDLLGVYATS